MLKRKTSKYVLYSLLGLLAAFLSFVTFLILVSVFTPSNALMPQGERVMVIVAHEDDGVIIAGAYCAENIKMGGEILVVFTTDGAEGDNPTMEAIRKREAHLAWRLAGVPEGAIVFLGYDSVHGLQKAEEIKEAISIVRELIEGFQPDIIFTSLYENGHYQHDATNYIVGEAYKLVKCDCVIYEGPEYNTYLSPLRTPRKLLQAISRITPFYEYHSPPEFIDSRPSYEFPLTEKLRELKKDMLAKYESQEVNWLQRSFAIRERFQKYERYDYTKPPFEYEGSLVRKINQLREFPVFSYFVQKMFGSPHPVHPSAKLYTYQLDFRED